MSDQIRSLTILILIFMLVILGVLVFLKPTFFGTIGLGVLSILISYNCWKLDKFEL